MCGFVGYINRETAVNKSKNLVNFFTQGLLCDSLRGKHGTGVLGVTDKGWASVYKRALAASDFLELANAKKIIESTSNVFMVGHNRWATRGTHTADNTHPFTHDHITLFHNGTVDYYQTLNKGKTFDVDSDSVAHFIANSTDTIQALESIEGTYSLVWYNDTEETLNFARNEDKPMFFGQVKDSQSFVFASEPGMIRWLCARNGIELSSIFETKEELLITIPVDPQEKTTTTPFKAKKKVVYHNYHRGVHHQKPEEKKTEVAGIKEGDILAGKVKAWIPYNNSNNPALRNGYFVVKISDSFQVNLPGYGESVVDSYMGKNVKVKLNSIKNDDIGYGSFVSFDNVIVVGKKYKGPGNSLIPLEEYKRLVSKGCSCCDSEITEDDHEDINWNSDGTVECPTCTAFITRYGMGV